MDLRNWSGTYTMDVRIYVKQTNQILRGTHIPVELNLVQKVFRKRPVKKEAR